MDVQRLLLKLPDRDLWWPLATLLVSYLWFLDHLLVILLQELHADLTTYGSLTKLDRLYVTKTFLPIEPAHSNRISLRRVLEGSFEDRPDVLG